MFKPIINISTFFFSLSLIVSGVLLTSCDKEHMTDCFKGTGTDVTEERNLNGFTKIHANDNVDVTVYPGHDFKIKVTAGKKLIDGITTTIDDNYTLQIKNENKCNWVRSFKNKFKVDVWLPELQELNAYGSGSITLADTIRFNHFYFNNWSASGSVLLLFNAGSIHINMHTGPADVVMKGKAAINYLYHNGNGPVHGEDLQTEITYTENKGTNDEYVFATKILEAKISYIGNVYYKETPDSIFLRGDGSGKFIPF